MLTLQITISCLLVIAVLWFMWKLPRRGEALFGWAPTMALLSAWGGLAALLFSLALWLAPFPDLWVTLVFLLMDPAAIAAGTLVLWIYRGYESSAPTVDLQRLQAKTGITLGLIAVTVGYFYVFWSKAPGTPVGV